MYGPSEPTTAAFTDWLTRFGDAWEAADAARMAALFVIGATFQPTPFADLLRGRRAIGDYWQAEFAGKQDIHFEAQVLGAGGTYGLAHWRISFRSTLGPGALRDGVLLAALDARRRCTSLRAWWHEREPAALQADTSE